MFYWFLKFLALGPVLKLIFRPWAEGTENLPKEGAVILASNHLSYSDWLFTPCVVPRRVTFVAKAEYFEGSGIKGWLQKTFFSGAGQVPIDRTSGSSAAGAIKTQLRLLENGNVCGIYPEGTRSHDGKLYRGRTGVARLALESGVRVIPMCVINTNVVAPPGRILGKVVRVGVRFGKPLDFSRYEGMQDDRYILRAITDEIMYEIMRLSDQEYVDLYAQDAKKRDRDVEREDAKVAARAEADEVWDEIRPE
ncbi:lysophospholipid acyltransferase family protein [Aeromicrobium sp.]|uniref:lysophospholipid acyltransferase family protein n=1 Tax=Aeromicrobium sp. TaxID=1871063 RepID=UPI0030BFCE74